MNRKEILLFLIENRERLDFNNGPVAFSISNKKGKIIPLVVIKYETQIKVKVGRFIKYTYRYNINNLF